MNPEQWLSLKWNGGSTMSDRWLNQSKIIQFSVLYEIKIQNKHKNIQNKQHFILNTIYMIIFNCAVDKALKSAKMKMEFHK